MDLNLANSATGDFLERKPRNNIHSEVYYSVLCFTSSFFLLNSFWPLLCWLASPSTRELKRVRLQAITGQAVVGSCHKRFGKGKEGEGRRILKPPEKWLFSFLFWWVGWKESVRSGVKQTELWFLVVPLTSCVSLGKQLSWSDSASSWRKQRY